MATKTKANQAAHTGSGDLQSAATSQPHYEEWLVEKKQTRIDEDKVKVDFDKLKKLRDCVKITEEEAAVLNAGITSPGDHGRLTMYLLPGQEMDEFSYTIKTSR